MMIDGDKVVPSREFLSMMIIMLKKAQKETGSSLLEWLEDFEDIDTDIDPYDDASLRKAISKLLKENYDDDKPNGVYTATS